MMSDEPQEWRQLAWRIAAHDLAIDLDVDDGEFLGWAEDAFGSQAREFIAFTDALADVRLGPETHPKRAPNVLAGERGKRRS